MQRLARTIVFGSLLLLSLVSVSTIHFVSRSQVNIPSGLRAQRDTWTPLMDVLKDKRPRVTDEQLERLRNVSIENVWGAIQGKGYRQCFVTHLKTTQPGVKLVGRALTMRYLPQRPDLDEGVRQLAKEGNWDPAFNVRGGEDAKPGDVVVVELGAMVDRATFMGTMTGLGMKLRGVKGVVVDGGIRDLNEFLGWKDFPVYYAGGHASAMADQIGVEPIDRRLVHRDKKIIEQRLKIEKYLDFRFRNFVVVTEDEISNYYRDVFVSRFRTRFPGRVVPNLTEVHDRIERRLTESKIESDTDKFLDAARERAEIVTLNPV